MAKPGVKRGMYISWTPRRDAELAQLYTTMSAPKVAAKLGCSTTSVYFRARRMGLTKSNKQPRDWQPAEDDLLFDQYHAGAAAALAEKLGRSISSVRARVHKLGICRRDTEETVVPEAPVAPVEQGTVIGIEPRIHDEEVTDNGTRRIRFIDHSYHSHGLKNRHKPRGMSSLGYV